MEGGNPVSAPGLHLTRGKQRPLVARGGSNSRVRTWSLGVNLEPGTCVPGMTVQGEAGQALGAGF